MSLRATNLNLLPILRALLAEGSVSRAATELGLSQPATSNALARLRDLLGDPLLVPLGRTMRLTPRAEQLRPGVDQACSIIEALLFNSHFVASAADRAFVVATPDYLASLIGPPLFRQLTDTAPGISVRFIDVEPDFRRQVTAGKIDVAIIARADDVLRGFNVEGGYHDRLVGVVAADHPLAKTPPRSAVEMRAFPRIGLDIGPPDLRAAGRIDELMVYEGGRPTFSASHLRVLPLLIAQTLGVAIMPEAFARVTAIWSKIAYFDLPTPVTPLELCLMWSPVVEDDPAHRWFRGALTEAMRLIFSNNGG